MNDEFSDVVIVVAAYNEESTIITTLESLNKHFNQVVVVNDGSRDSTKTNAKSAGAIVLTHPINLGQGAALQTGITKALTLRGSEFIVTFDADGQHSVNSAVEMVRLAKTTNVDLVLGSRFLKNTYHGMPQRKKLILKLGILFTRFDTGLKITDVHNGLRVMNRKFAESLTLQKSGMAHASEILTHAKKVNANWIEAPAEIFYTKYSLQKGQSIFNAINILTEMLHK